MEHWRKHRTKEPGRPTWLQAISVSAEKLNRQDGKVELLGELLALGQHVAYLIADVHIDCVRRDPELCCSF